MDNIFGIHEPGGEKYILEAGRTGYIVFTEELGHNPDDTSSKDFGPWTYDGKIQPIVRLNNGYGSTGTIPLPEQYENFSKRVGHYVANSHGAHIWVIGNEPNIPVERPNGQVILPEDYADCYAACRSAILASPGHEQDIVLVAGPAPWNNQTVYANNPNGDWVQYLADVLLWVGHACDGLALHAYTHGSNPDLIKDQSTMNSPFEHRHFNFFALYDFMNGIPVDLHHLVIYITETDQDVPWLDQNNGWIQAMYAEVNEWNMVSPDRQIKAACLYRWPNIDKWVIEGKNGVIEDFKAALQHDYQTFETVFSVSKFNSGDRVKVVADVKLRSTPGFNTKAYDENVIRILSVGMTATVTGSGRTADFLIWYPVDVDGPEALSGFVAGVAPDATVLLELAPSIHIRLPFDGSFPETRDFGGNAAEYARFNQKGHNGIDFGLPSGTPVLAAATGLCIEVGSDPTGYGNYIKLQHKWGETLYAHLAVQISEYGENIQRGQQIGLSGNTGNSSGPHLHFGMRVEPYDRADGFSGFTDPSPYIERGRSIKMENPVATRDTFLTRRLGSSFDALNLVIKGVEERPDRAVYAKSTVKYVIADVWSTRDGSWDSKGATYGMTDADRWAWDSYQKPWGAPDAFKQAGADHHMLGLVIGLDGKPEKGVDLVAWSGENGDKAFAGIGSPNFVGTRFKTDEESGWANQGMAGGGGANYNPVAGQRGPYCLTVAGQNAEVLVGLGMPGDQHVSIFVVWKAVAVEATSPIVDIKPVSLEPLTATELIRQAQTLLDRACEMMKV